MHVSPQCAGVGLSAPSRIARRQRGSKERPAIANIRDPLQSARMLRGWIAIFGIIALAACPLAAKPSDAARRAQEARVKKAVEEIKQQCRITTGQFGYDAGRIYFNYDGMIERQKLDCAADRAVLADVTFDSYDASAPYGGPRRFIAKAAPKRLDAVVEALIAAHWTITHRADAGDGIGFLEIETPQKATRREVQDFLDQFREDYRDVAIGLSPLTRAGYDVPNTATEFRDIARQMYGNLAMPSCGTPPGFDRESMLKPDRQAIALFERDLSSTPAARHLELAREDANYDLSPSSCWADDDPAFAKIHVGMVHNSVRPGVSSLRKLAPAVDPLPTEAAPSNAVAFRSEVRNLIQWTLPLCSYTSKGSNESVFAAARKAIGLFEARLKGTPYALQYSVAKEDASYRRSQTTAECDEPGNEPVAKLSVEILASAKKQIARLEGLTHVQ